MPCALSTGANCWSRCSAATRTLTTASSASPLKARCANRSRIDMASTSVRATAGASGTAGGLTILCCKHRLLCVDNTHPLEAIMSYDVQRAREHFQAKVDFTTGTHEVLGMIDQGRTDVVIVDVRLPSDYRAGHIPGAINLPKGRWGNARGLSKDKLHILYCYSQTCHLAAEAA